MDSLLPVAALLIGLAIGGIAVWLVLRGNAEHAYDRGRADADSERVALTERLNAQAQDDRRFEFPGYRKLTANSRKAKRPRPSFGSGSRNSTRPLSRSGSRPRSWRWSTMPSENCPTRSGPGGRSLEEQRSCIPAPASGWLPRSSDQGRSSWGREGAPAPVHPPIPAPARPG